MIYEREAHNLLDSLADTVSRYNAFEKEANEAGMKEMEKEAGDLKKNIGELAKKVADSKVYKRIAPTADAAVRGALNGALTGTVAGAISNYRDPKDKKVHRLKNMWHGAWTGATTGAAVGIGRKEIIDRRKPFIKSAHAQLDEMVKEAMPVGAVATAVGAISGLKKAAPIAKGAFSNAGKVLTSAGSIGKTMKANGVGNTLMNAAKAVDTKALGKAGNFMLNRTMTAATIGGIADGVAGAFKQQNNNDNMYS